MTRVRVPALGAETRRSRANLCGRYHGTVSCAECYRLYLPERVDRAIARPDLYTLSELMEMVRGAGQHVAVCGKFSCLRQLMAWRVIGGLS